MIRKDVLEKDKRQQRCPRKEKQECRNFCFKARQKKCSNPEKLNEKNS
jgi:hypothetical protein